MYPVAIKYDPKFGDAFWNSSKEYYSLKIHKILFFVDFFSR